MLELSQCSARTACPIDTRRDPETTEEEEFVENLFDVVASCLLLEENKAVFVEAEGEGKRGEGPWVGQGPGPWSLQSGLVCCVHAC